MSVYLAPLQSPHVFRSLDLGHYREVRKGWREGWRGEGGGRGRERERGREEG